MKALSPILALFLSVILCYTGCIRKPKLSDKYIDSLKGNYKSLIKTMDTSWNSMITEDNTKLRYLKRLLEEVSYTNIYDSAAYSSLLLRIDELRATRYDRNTMKDSPLIDHYDSLTISLVSDVEKFATSNPRYEQFPLMKELITDINELDNGVLFKRSDYDKTVDRFNEFVDANLKVLKEVYPDSNFNKKAVFRISAN
jgi:hypothetical protein